MPLFVGFAEEQRDQSAFRKTLQPIHEAALVEFADQTGIDEIFRLCHERFGLRFFQSL